MPSLLGSANAAYMKQIFNIKKDPKRIVELYLKEMNQQWQNYRDTHCVKQD